MKKILIVDNEAGLVQLLKLNLEATGRYQVKTETKGTEAINAARAFQPDLILLDVVMPDLSGPDVVRKIKADKETQHIPVVFLTAAVLKNEDTNSPEEESETLQPFISKPVSTAELIEYIEAAIPATPQSQKIDR